MMNFIKRICFLSFLLSISYSIVGQEWNHHADFAHDFENSNDGHGTTMDISGDYAVVGISGFDIPMASSNVGAVLVLKHEGNAWVKDTLIVNPDGAFDDYFGKSVAISGNRIVVGAVLDDDNGNNSGSAFIYELNTGTGIWSYSQKIVGPTSFGLDNFGGVVAIDGDWIAVSSLGQDLAFTNTGIVDMFKFEGGSWVHKTTIEPVTQQNSLGFGQSLELENDRLIVGVPSYDAPTLTDVGIVYEYKNNADDWTLFSVVQPTVDIYYGEFGESISLEGDVLVVGSPRGILAGEEMGRFYVFNWDNTNSLWDQNHLIDNPEGEIDDMFGSDVHVFGDRIAVGCSDKGVGGFLDAGLVYVYELEGTLLELKHVFNSPVVEANEQFGFTVVSNEDYILVGAPLQDGAFNNSGITNIFKYCKSDTLMNITACDEYENAQGIYTSSGIYIDTLSNINGCDSVVNLNLTIVDSPTLSFVITGATCGESNGAVDATVNGGTLPFDFIWNNGSNLEDLEDVSANSYYLTLIDGNGCEAYNLANVASSEISISGSVNDNVCRGLTSGSIDLSVVGTASPFTFEWTNGAEVEDISNLAAGQYEVVVTDMNGCQTNESFIVEEPEAFDFSFVVTEANCGISDGSIDVTVMGGTGAFDFDWTDAIGTQVSTDEDPSSLAQGVYTVEVTDENGCSGSGEINLSEIGSPVITLDSLLSSSCLNDGALFTSINSVNAISTILWSNTETTEDITNLSSGNYSITVEDVAGCSGVSIFNVPSLMPDPVQICMVNVDQSTNTNQVIWEKPITSEIDKFVIYRESSVSGQYQVVDTVDYLDESELTDSTAFPSIRSWKYKLSTINTCGVESQKSAMHKTVHCAISTGLGGVYNIFWDDYIGFDYTTFDLWRYTASAGWENIQSLPLGNYSYTDTPSDVNEIDYYVSVSSPSTCTSTKANDYNSSRSNRSSGIFSPSDTTINVQENDLIEYSVSPNPFSDKITIRYNSTEKVQIRIVSASGQVISFDAINSNAQFDVSSLEKGIYILEFELEGELYREKLIKN